MPYPTDNVKLGYFDRINLGASKAGLGSWLSDLAASVVTTDEMNGKNFATSSMLGGYAKKIDVSASMADVPSLFYLGTPKDGGDDYVLEETELVIGEYDLDVIEQPDVPRNLIITIDPTGDEEALGTITVTGKDFADKTISEIINLDDDTVFDNGVYTGAKPFKTITKIVGTGLDADEGDEGTVKIGIGDLIGLPMKLDDNCRAAIAVFDFALKPCREIIGSPAMVEIGDIVFDGLKTLYVFIVE